MNSGIADKSLEELRNLETFGCSKALSDYIAMPDLFPIEKLVFEKYLPPPPSRILDIGCGTGRTTKHLVDRGYQVLAGDVVTAMIEAGRQLHPHVDFLKLDATALDLPSAEFEVVLFSFNGLDYIYPFLKRLQALREIWRVLKPGGIFIYSSHNILGRFTRTFKPYRRCVRYHLKLLQDSPGRELVRNYWRSRDHGGWLIYYCGIPIRQIHTLKRVGFEWVAIESMHSQTLWGITWKDHWPHYIAKCPSRDG
jgi:SAM-dependent methyltransferase